MTSVLLLNAFDAYAGSQRVAVALVDSWRARGVAVNVRLGFGCKGFFSDQSTSAAFLPIDRIAVRKLLYPVWLLAVMTRALVVALRGQVVWANTVYGAPATLLALFLAPRQVVIHIHEINFSKLFRWLLSFAAKRGATLVCVSKFQRAALGVDATILYNGVGGVPPAAPAHRSRFIFVGTTAPAKGFTLFVSVVKALEGSGLESVAYLPSQQSQDLSLLDAAQSAGIALHFGVTDPAVMFADGFLSLLATDPLLWTETFSLVCAESIWNLVPVVSAGTFVAAEVAGDALAFDAPDRNPVHIAGRVRALLDDPIRYSALVAACSSRRNEFSLELFGQRSTNIVQTITVKEPLHG